MAWGKLTDVGWINAFTSGKYATDNYFKYQIDESERKLRVIITRQRVRSLNSAYSYSGPVNNGCQFLGGSKDAQYSKGYDTEDQISVSGGGTVNIPSGSDRTIAAVYTYNTDGSVPTINVATQMIFDLSGYDKTYYGFSNQNWKSQDLESKFPSIGAELEPVTDLTVIAVNATNATITYVGSSKAVKYEITYTDGANSVTNEIADQVVSLTGLKMSTNYTVSITAIDSSGNKSKAISTTFTTLSQAQIYVNVSGTAKKGLVWVNVGGAPKRALDIWVNVGGTAKHIV